MCSACKNCHLFLQIEEERLDWCKEFVFKNFSLFKKLSEQQELNKILKKRLQDKQSSFLSEHTKIIVREINNLLENKKIKTDYHLEKGIKEKLDEITNFSRLFNFERETMQKEIEDNEKYFSDNITYLNGLIDYFRDSLFDELDKSNKLKQYFIQKFSELATTSHQIVLTTLKEQQEILQNELKSRYQKTIQKSKEEIERQSQLVTKLRKHNKQLYLQIQKSKVENEQKVLLLEKNLDSLKLTIKKLKESKDHLHTQIKLEVEGCQNDISDTRRTLRKLVKP